MKMGWKIGKTFLLGRYSHYVFFDQNITILYKFLSAFKILCLVLLIPADGMYGLVFRNRQRFPFFRNYVYEHTAKYIYILGMQYETIVRKIKKKIP